MVFGQKIYTIKMERKGKVGSKKKEGSEEEADFILVSCCFFRL